MAEGFEYIAKLKDEVSGPAKQIKASLHGIGGEVKQTHGVLSELKHHLIGSVTAGTLLAGGIEKIAEGAKEAAAELGELAVEGFRFAVEAREFKEQMTEGFADFLESKQAGEETFAEVQNIATALHAPIEQVGDLTNQLLTAGLNNQAELTSTVEAITALQRVKGAEAAGKVQSIVQRGIAAGQFKLNPRMLAGTGTTLDELSAILGKKLGVSAKVAAAELKTGKIRVEDGIDAINQALLEGKIGERAKKMFKLTDIATDFKNNMMKIFSGVNTAPFLDSLKQVGVLFDENTASGKMFKSVILGAFNALTSVAGKAIKAVLLGFIYAQVYIVRAAIAVWPFIRVMKRIADIVPWLTVLKIGLIAIGAAAALMIAPFALMAAGGVALFSALVVSVDFTRTMVMGFINWFRSAWDALDVKAIGLNIINGIIDGVKAGASAAVDAVKDVGKGILNAGKEVLGIHSPSKEMAKLGEHASAGFAMGIESGAPMSQGAMAFAVKPPSMATPEYAGNGGKSITVNVGGVEIHGVQGAEQMAPMLETMFTDLLERVAVEVGG